MGKKKSRGGGSEYGKADSTASICGSSTLYNSDGELSDDYGLEPDEWADNIDLLYEKRGSTRESALGKFVSLLKADWQYEEGAMKQSQLSSLFLSSMKRGGTEGVVASRAFGLLTLTLGMTEYAEEMYFESLPALEPVLKTGKGADAISAAIDTLSLICFVAAEDAPETARIMRLLQFAVERSSNAAVKTSGLKGWSLLFTALSPSQLSPDFVEESLQFLGELLHADSIEVRGAAGEAVALLFDACDLQDLPHHGSDNDDDEEDGELDGLEDIVARMRDLASNRGDETRRNKKERGVQKKMFRELCAAVDDQNVPTQKVKLRHGDVLEVITLPDNVRLNYIRAALGDGFQVHLQKNTLLHQIFNFRPTADAPEKLTAREKRMYRSPSSAQCKDRSKAKSENRRTSANYKSSMLMG